ncbi:MAG TPA: hypothetical protein VFD60_14660 [Nitrososphaeraceae archaeon]|jgi:hypothetical protein|nr:hypothetical protein [Nitrososphaeraceae archaeon]
MESVRGPFQQYVLADLYAWLEAHSGFSHPYVNIPAAASITGTNSSFFVKMIFPST